MAAALVILAFCVVLLANIWFFLIRPAKPWSDKIGVVLQIVGMYTFAFAFLTKEDVLPREMLDNMTSPDLFKFLSGNFATLAAGFIALSIGMEPAKDSAIVSLFLHYFVLFALLVPFVTVAFFYLLVVTPLSYVAYLIVSVPVSAILRAHPDVVFQLLGHELKIQQIVSNHAVLIKNLAIAFPAVALRTSLELVQSYRSTLRAPDSAPRRVAWTTRHPRASAVMLGVCQVVLAVVLFANSVAMMSLPWTPSDDPDVVLTGEIAGAEIGVVLIAWVLVLLLAKVNRQRHVLLSARAADAAAAGRSDKMTRNRKRVRWLLIGAIPVAAVWMSFSVVAASRRQSFARQCDRDIASGCVAACDRDDLGACVRLGYLHDSGTGGLERNAVRAKQLYQAACDRGEALGCNNLGVMYLTGNGGLVKDVAQAVKLYSKACESGVALGCTNLGELYDSGEGVTARDSRRAADLYQKACGSSHAAGCANAGRLYERGGAGLDADPQRAIAFYQKACDQGAAVACDDLGSMYLNGRGGLPSNSVIAANLYEKACDGGYVHGCSNRGTMYITGQGGSVAEPARALPLFQKSCDAGDALGCGNLGVMYRRGMGGLSKDDTRAAALYQRACDAGSGLACSNLAAMYEQGAAGMPADPERAIALYRKACAGAIAAGCTSLKRLAP